MTPPGTTRVTHRSQTGFRSLLLPLLSSCLPHTSPLPSGTLRHCPHFLHFPSLSFLSKTLISPSFPSPTPFREASYSHPIPLELPPSPHPRKIPLLFRYSTLTLLFPPLHNPPNAIFVPANFGGSVRSSDSRGLDVKGRLKGASRLQINREDGSG